MNIQPNRRRHRCIAILFAMLFAASNHAFAFNEAGQPKTEAVSAILFDARRAQVVYSKAADEITHSPIANRIMTVLITLEKADLEAMVTASKDAANTEGAVLNLSVGEKYAVKNLLYALMLTGANDAAKAVAEYVGGSETGFVQLMNEYATKLGMAHTRFMNSTGAFDENQVTTAGDIAILLKYALSNSDFNRYFSTQAKPWYDEDKTLLLTNTNNMFWSYQGTDGGITASIDKKLQSIVTTATKNSMRLVCVLLDTPTNSMYADSIDILNYGFENWLYGTLVTAGSSQKVITVEEQTLNLIPTADVHYIYPKGQSFIKNITINVDETKLKPPITKNTIIGMMTFTLMDETKINVELYADREILPQKTKSQLMRERIKESKELLYVIAVLIIVELVMGGFKLYAFLRKQVIKTRSKRLRRR